jgi:hypothetical protein
MPLVHGQRVHGTLGAWSPWPGAAGAMVLMRRPLAQRRQLLEANGRETD